ncbi:MAG TPA: hypothetical protein VF094_04930 [Gaiellaceae bacterium]
MSARVHVIGSPGNGGSVGLVQGLRRLGLDAELRSAKGVMQTARRGDVVIARPDVLPTLDGVEPGLLAALLLDRRGVRVVNDAEALLVTHDKLRSAEILKAAGLPHPETCHMPADALSPPRPAPCVVKPRFGSWGRDVFRCDTDDQLARCLDDIRGRSWFKRHGALVQELLPVPGRDLRVVVAGGRVVGAAERRAAEGEWRTNLSLGGTLARPCLSEDAAELARTAAAVTGADLVGVDLLPLGGGRYAVLELNGAVEFDERYALAGRDVFADIAEALRLQERVMPRLLDAAAPVKV